MGYEYKSAMPSRLEKGTRRTYGLSTSHLCTEAAVKKITKDSQNFHGIRMKGKETWPNYEGKKTFGREKIPRSKHDGSKTMVAMETMETDEVSTNLQAT